MNEREQLNQNEIDNKQNSDYQIMSELKDIIDEKIKELHIACKS